MGGGYREETDRHGPHNTGVDLTGQRGNEDRQMDRRLESGGLGSWVETLQLAYYRDREKKKLQNLIISEEDLALVLGSKPGAGEVLLRTRVQFLTPIPGI